MEYNAEQHRADYLQILKEVVETEARKEREAEQEAKEFILSARRGGHPLVGRERGLWLEGAAWQRRQQWQRRVHDVLKRNTILEDCIQFFMERQRMNNPKDWKFILRSLKRYTRTEAETQADYDEALATITLWAAADEEQQP